MSDQQENENNEASDGEETIDPLGPTQVDPKRAFEMGAETPDAHAVPAHWLPPEPEVLDPLFPDYDLHELIGRGGMGAVYRGVQKSLDRPVAIKVLPPEMAEADPSFAARFEREAKSMARLDHPNIVHVYDFGRTEAGHWFIVMEFVDGMDFHQLIRSGELDQTGALNAVSQICDALEYAHSQGYVHRDIKPANIFINQKGILKVGDFGLAKMIEGETGDTTIREPRQPMLTQTGISMGTPDYCSPEQLEGRHIDHRADIYSLGVMFYEMLTRELPRGNFPPPSKKVQVDVRIDDVVLRAMESEPERRYSSAGEMRTEVDEVRTGPVVEPLPVAEESRSAAPPAKSKGSRAVAIVLIVLACLFGLFVLGGILVGFGFLLLKKTAPKIEPLDSVPEVQVREVSQSPQAASADRYGLPAFHGELRPIPGTAGWRSEEPGEVIAFAQFENLETNPPEAVSNLPDNLKDVVSLYIESPSSAAAIRNDGSVVWWGTDRLISSIPPPTLVDVVALAFGQGGIALHSDGAVTGWGNKSDATGFNQGRVIAISCFKQYAYDLVTEDGKLHSFGYAREGIAPPPSSADQIVGLVPNPATKTIFGIQQDGTVLTWGNIFGDRLPLPAGLPPVWSMTGSGAALLQDGSAITWETSSPTSEFEVVARKAQTLIGHTGLDLDQRAIRVSKRKWLFTGHRPDAIRNERQAEGCTQLVAASSWFYGIRPESSGPKPDLRSELESRGLSMAPSAPSASATKDAPFTNSLGMEFVPVPIPNGSSGGKRALFSRWETRVSDYRAFAEATDREWPAPEFEQGDDHPAVNVSWKDAVAFCGWLSVREREAGTIGQLERYRLPTDHEWSCAVEIGHLENPNFSPISKSPPKQDRPPPGTDTAVKGYPMGDRVFGGFANSAGEETKAAGLSNNIVRGMEDGYAATAPVGSYKPNRFGLFDISGNVWEWCQDTVDSDSKDTRVRRGACWKTVFIPEMRSARREGATQDSRTDITGFRCVLSAP